MDCASVNMKCIKEEIIKEEIIEEEIIEEEIIKEEIIEEEIIKEEIIEEEIIKEEIIEEEIIKEEIIEEEIIKEEIIEEEIIKEEIIKEEIIKEELEIPIELPDSFSDSLLLADQQIVPNVNIVTSLQLAVVPILKIDHESNRASDEGTNKLDNDNIHANPRDFNEMLKVGLNNYGKWPRCVVLLKRLKSHLLEPTNADLVLQKRSKRQKCVSSKGGDATPSQKKACKKNFSALAAPSCSASSSTLFPKRSITSALAAPSFSASSSTLFPKRSITKATKRNNLLSTGNCKKDTSLLSTVPPPLPTVSPVLASELTADCSQSLPVNVHNKNISEPALHINLPSPPPRVIVPAYTEAKKHVLLSIDGDQALQFMALLKPDSRLPLPGIKIHQGDQSFTVRNDVEVTTQGIPLVPPTETNFTAMPESVQTDRMHSGAKTKNKSAPPLSSTTSTITANLEEKLGSVCSATNSPMLPAIAFSALDSQQRPVLFTVTGRKSMLLLDQIMPSLERDTKFFMTDARIRFSNQTFSIAAKTEIFTKGIAGMPDSDSLLADQAEGKLVFTVQEVASPLVPQTLQGHSNNTQTDLMTLQPDETNPKKDSISGLHIFPSNQSGSEKDEKRQSTESTLDSIQQRPSSTLALSAFNIEKNEHVIIRLSGRTAMQILKYIKLNNKDQVTQFTEIELLHCGQTYLVTPNSEIFGNDSPVLHNTQ